MSDFKDGNPSTDTAAGELVIFEYLFGRPYCTTLGVQERFGGGNGDCGSGYS